MRPSLGVTALATALATGLALTAATVDVAASAETHLVRNGPIAFREVAEDGLGGPLQRMRPTERASV